LHKLDSPERSGDPSNAGKFLCWKQEQFIIVGFGQLKTAMVLSPSLRFAQYLELSSVRKESNIEEKG